MCLTVSVGFEYESCLDLILWEKRTAVLQGYELDASNMGGWMLDKHHILDVQNGTCQHDKTGRCSISQIWFLRLLGNILTLLTEY